MAFTTASRWLCLAIIMMMPTHLAAAEATCEGQGASLRLLTYNVAMVGTFVSNEDVFGMDDKLRAKLIANGILRGDHDVVALNEVFKDDAKWVFYELLKERFPHVVYKLGESDLDQDSGLMLFSRFPFKELSGSRVMDGSVTAVSNSQLKLSIDGIVGENWTDVSYTVFEGDACSRGDCWADKGAALVRIENPCTDLVENVVFTHMQASYGDDDQDDQRKRRRNRSVQLRLIREMIQQSLNTHEQQTEPIYLMGDLNISGGTDPEDPITTSQLTEWQLRFSNAPAVTALVGERFTACGDGVCTWDPTTGTGSLFVDSWYYEGSRQDSGATTRGEGRLDYILRSDPVLPPFQTPGPSRLCAQHPRVAYELGDQDGWERYSDHLGVSGDFNRRAAHCDAKSALPVVLDGKGDPPVNHQQIEGRITFPGSMQWYRLPLRGTYSINTSPQVDFDVYRETDLSRPIRARGEDHERGRRYAVTQGALYVRVFASSDNKPNRGWQGSYTIDFYRHSCNRPTDDCSLPPASPQPATWGIGPVNEEDALWMSFETDTSDEGLFPTLELIITRTQEVELEVEIVDEALTETYAITSREELNEDGDDFC